MAVVHIVVQALRLLPASVWLGAMVLLIVAARLIEQTLKGRRTEGRQIVRKLRGVFQRIELIILIVLWAVNLVDFLLGWVARSGYPGRWGTAQVVAAGLLVVPTLAALYSTYYLTRTIRKREGQLGSYADKNDQIRVRKSIAALLKQAEMLTMLKVITVAGVIVAAIVGGQ